MKDRIARYQEEVVALSSGTISWPLVKSDGEVLVELKDVNVSYHERKVSISHSAFRTLHQWDILRCCKTRTGRFVRAKDGISKDQTVCLERFRTKL